MRVAKITKQDEAQFAELASVYGTVFHSKEWTGIFKDSIERYGFFNGANELLGGFITYNEKKLGMSIYRNPPCTPSIGPFIRNDAKNPSMVMNSWKKVLMTMAEFIRGQNYDIVSISLGRQVIDMQPFIWNKFKVVPTYTYLINLNKPERQIWEEMHFKKRNAINRAKRDRLQVELITNYDIVRELVINTFTSRGMKYDMEVINKILFEFASKDNCYAIATYENSQPIAASFYIHDKESVYQLFAGCSQQIKHRGAEGLVIWEAIKYAKSLSLKWFDFEGSNLPRIEKFFRGFGGQLTAAYRVNRAKLPIELILKFVKREIF